MIDPTLAASAVSLGLDLLGSLGQTEEPKANDVVNRDDFLTLLITQLQNQDPLDPVSSENFSAQLAQFSSLEQLTQINDKLSALGQSGTADTSPFELLGLLGRQVQGVGSTITVTDGVASSLGFELGQTGRVEAQIFDASGRQVATLDLGALTAGEHALDLAALGDAPELADGAYTVLINQVDGDASVAVPTVVTGRVTGVDYAADPPVLLLGETRLALEDVREIRES